MRIKTLLLTLLVLLLALSVWAAPPKGKQQKTDMALQIDNTTFIDANRILMFVTNHGNFGRDLSDYFAHDYGTWYPYGGDPSKLYTDAESEWTPNYASGIWVGAVDSATGEVRTTISEYSSEYVPGPMVGGTFQSDLPEFKVYKLYADSMKDNPNQDYLDYMQFAIPNQGAPWELDSVGDTIPEIIGDQFLWSVYNDADPSAHTNMSTNPLGIEVKQAMFAFTRDDPLGDIVFFRYKVYNKGANTLEDCYISIWCDPDLGSSGDDYVACDTTLGLGYVWQSSATDENYSPNAVPSMGFDFLQGPLVGRTTETADLPDGRMWGVTYPDSVNLGMESFNKYINGTDPDDFSQTYNYQRGLTRDGGDYVYNGQVLKYVLSGDPVSGAGDIDVAPADRRFMQSTGPIVFRPGDSTEIYAAMICGQAINNKTSISLMRFHDRFAQITYDSSFVVLEPPAPPVVDASVDANVVSLTWGNHSEISSGSLEFEGYTIWQGASLTGPWTQVDNFDIANSLEDVFDEKFNPVTAVPEIVLKHNGTNLGLKRNIQITDDFIQGGAIRNLTPYYYRIEAYAVNVDAPLGFRSLTASTVVEVIPEAGVPDYETPESIGEMLTVTHSAGISDGVITVEVVNPDLLTGDSYKVDFADTVGIVVDTIIADPINFPDDTTFVSTDLAWHLINTTTGDTLLAWQTSQEGDDNYVPIDGFICRVSGPAAGFKSFQVVANAGGVVDPPDAGAFWFQDFPVPLDNDPDGYITDAQQVFTPGGQWGFHTGDNGGTNDGGDRGSYAKFLERVMRNDNADDVGIYDFEMRFTGDTTNPGTLGSYAVGAFDAAPEPVWWVPFELWRIGIATPDDPSDDVRMFPWMIDTDASGTYNLANWGDSDNGGGDYEHSASSGNNDPFTDWIYWVMPDDDSPGSAGYDASVAMLDLVGMTAGTYDFNGEETMARTVLVSWNGGSAPPFNQGLPEEGTVFRMITGKPNASSDEFSFSTTPPSELSAKSADLLDQIVTVPNPLYLISPYNTTPGNYDVKFHHLPTTCTISIYNLSGELLRTIEKDDPTTSIATWNVLTEQGLPVASGIYLYVIDAPGIGQKIGKMAIFIEQEVLKIY